MLNWQISNLVLPPLQIVSHSNFSRYTVFYCVSRHNLYIEKAMYLKSQHDLQFEMKGVDRRQAVL